MAKNNFVIYEQAYTSHLKLSKQISCGQINVYDILFNYNKALSLIDMYQLIYFH